MYRKVFSKPILSKSTFIYGCQCVKRLWLYKNKPELRDEMSEELATLFKAGTNIGLLAQNLFPGGVNAAVAKPWMYKQAVAKTSLLINAGHHIIYEAAFIHEGIFCIVDILVKKNNKWTAFEVKSGGELKEVYILDSALQYYTITESGFLLTDFVIVHRNRDYESVESDDIDLENFFIPISVLGKILDQKNFIKEKIMELKTIILLKRLPNIEMGEHCQTPYTCDFLGFCSKENAENIL